MERIKVNVTIYNNGWLILYTWLTRFVFKFVLVQSIHISFIYNLDCNNVSLM